jgi:hypothetical protein
MGYCMEQMGASFAILPENVMKALKAVKAMHKRVDQNGGGGSWKNGKTTARWYSWVSEDFHLKNTLSEILHEWRWEIEHGEEGGVIGIQFEGEKLGDDEQLFDAIAPFVEEGSYIEMMGEDGTRWRWEFDGKMVVEQTMEQIMSDKLRNLRDTDRKHTELRDKLSMLIKEIPRESLSPPQVIEAIEHIMKDTE